MYYMRKIDVSADPTELDGHGLKILLAILETGSITGAAGQLGVTQSAISHTVEKLRRVLNDPLFVKSGRGVVATAHALSLRDRARHILDDMEAIARGPNFSPAMTDVTLVIAANDFQRDLLLPAFQKRVSPRVRELTIKIVPSEAPTAEMLRERHVDLIITPRPPEGTDIMQKRLLVDRVACFFDPKVRRAPRSLKEYLAALHVTVIHEGGRKTLFDEEIDRKAGRRKVGVIVPNFSGVRAFLSGSQMLASIPSLMTHGIMQGFGMAPLPCQINPLPMYVVWHLRHHDDPLHHWIRDELEVTTKSTLAHLTAAK